MIRFFLFPHFPCSFLFHLVSDYLMAIIHCQNCKACLFLTVLHCQLLEFTEAQAEEKEEGGDPNHESKKAN
jgi:hypothetical protein